MNKTYLIKNHVAYCLLLSCLLLCSGIEAAEAPAPATPSAVPEVSLLNIESKSMPMNRVQFILEFSATPPTPSGFAMDNPATMVFDFAHVQSNLSKQLSSQKLVAGVVTELNVVQSSAKTRLLLNVQNVVPYTIDYQKNKVIITLDNDVQPFSISTDYTISSFDFRRGESGEGRLIVDFSTDTVPVDFSEDNNEMRVEFRGATIPEKLLRKFDVSDFGTNIQKINIDREDNNVVMTIVTTGTYEKMAYQMDKQYIVQVKPTTQIALQQLISQKFKFSGERISLNFQDIPIRSVLQLIADFANLNVVVSDTVTGNVTLRLENIPWDEALSFILQSKGLAQKASGNVILIGPSEEMTAREQSDLEAQQQIQALAPLVSEYIQVNYAKAADMVTMIKATGNTLLSTRGQISVDTRTNTLLV
ncbi:MAG TPA: AMIN domain-containing protein, partial [Gammaproteobacteria bacterium]|nr:AMIN domain-containing protein [Gammaproteobacteria bacterium]